VHKSILVLATILAACTTTTQPSDLEWYPVTGQPSDDQTDLDIAACEGRVNRVIIGLTNAQINPDVLDSVMVGCMAERGYGLRPL
jgi:hypothetical protein